MEIKKITLVCISLALVIFVAVYAFMRVYPQHSEGIVYSNDSQGYSFRHPVELQFQDVGSETRRHTPQLNQIQTADSRYGVNYLIVQEATSTDIHSVAYDYSEWSVTAPKILDTRYVQITGYPSRIDSVQFSDSGDAMPDTWIHILAEGRLYTFVSSSTGASDIPTALSVQDRAVDLFTHSFSVWKK